MIQLRTFGSIELTAADRPGVAAVLAQPKRFALLVYLAVAAPRSFVRRDTLLALFWPETDQAHGRKVLRQTLYLLRQSLGADTITSRGDDELGVDPAVLQCDVVQFEAALSAGRTAEALEQYRGDFLVGFHVPDAAPELDEWMQSEARRLRALATNGAWSLAGAEEQAGNRGGAAHWARRALALDPLNDKLLSEVMQLLVRVGDRAGALQAYHEYARRAAADLGMQPDRDVADFAESLRSPPESSPPRTRDAAPAITESVAQLASESAPATTASIEPRARARWRTRAVVLWSAAALAAVTLGVVLVRNTRAPPTQPVIAVGTISDASVVPQQQASNVPADLLSTSLARLTGLQVIPVTRLYDLQSQLRAARRPATSTLEAAKQAGADQLIEGTLHRLSSGRLQLDLQVMDPRNGAVVRAYRAEGTDLFAAVDEATALIAVAYGLATPREGIAQVTTASLVAYRLYDQGLHAFYQDDLTAAYRLFRAALAEDTTFAMAAYYAGMSAHGAAREESGGLLLRAVRLAGRVPDRERLLIQEAVAGLGMSATASVLADTMAARYPLDPDAQFALGHVLERRGDFLAAARQYRRVIAMDSLSLRLAARCLACDAYERLWWSYLYADSVSAAERVAREFAAVRPSGGRALLLISSALARQGRTSEVLKVWRAMDSLRTGTVNLDLGAATLAIREGDFATADERLQRSLREGSPATRERAAWYLVLSLRNQGRYREALTLTDRTESTLTRPIVLFEMGRSAEAAKAFEAQVGYDVGAFPGHTARHQTWLLTHVSTSMAATGDTARLSLLADSVERLGTQSAFGRDLRLHHYIRGLLWNARGQPARAVDEFRSSVWSWSEGFTRANYELARTLIALKQPAQAVYPLQAALRGDLESSNLYVTRTVLHEVLARTFDLLGQRDSAAAHYRKVVNAWHIADPMLTARRNAAQLRLNALGAPGGSDRQAGQSESRTAPPRDEHGRGCF